MSTLMRPAALLAAFLCVSPDLTAQEAGAWAASCSLIQGLDGLEKITAARGGLGLGISREQTVLESQVPIRLGLFLHGFPGQETVGGLKTSLQNVQLAGDVVLETPVKGLRWVTGLSLNRFQVSNSGIPQVDAKGVYQTYWPAVPDSGIKLGLRIGAVYRFNARWSGEVLYQVSELGRTPERIAASVAPAAVKGPTNPAWIQFGVHVHF